MNRLAQQKKNHTKIQQKKNFPFKSNVFVLNFHSPQPFVSVAVPNQIICHLNLLGIGAQATNGSPVNPSGHRQIG